jgi:hypothetical protein
VEKSVFVETRSEHADSKVLAEAFYAAAAKLWDPSKGRQEPEIPVMSRNLKWHDLSKPQKAYFQAPGIAVFRAGLSDLYDRMAPWDFAGARKVEELGRLIHDHLAEAGIHHGSAFWHENGDGYKDVFKELALKIECAGFLQLTDGKYSAPPASLAGETQDLIRRLREDGSTGLDMSPGNPLSAEAASRLEQLIKYVIDIGYDNPNRKPTSQFQEPDEDLVGGEALPVDDEFQECAKCEAKPGSPILCHDCLQRRKEFYEARDLADKALRERVNAHQVSKEPQKCVSCLAKGGTCQECLDAIIRDRQRVYGDTYSNHANAGLLFRGILQHHFGINIPEIPPHVVALLVASLKLLRASSPGGEVHQDNYDDGINYLRIARQCAERGLVDRMAEKVKYEQHLKQPEQRKPSAEMRLKLLGEQLDHFGVARTEAISDDTLTLEERINLLANRSCPGGSSNAR